jgi:hypothetical protein
MDRRGRRAALILALGAALSLPAAAAPLTAQRWLAAGADPRVLTRRPAECLARPASADAALSVEIGRAAFRSPTLLGGQAARAGLSCESCHRNGRSNPDFHFPGISGEPGTADVTASLFSTHRGDGTFNPVAIPDLGGPRERLKVVHGPLLRTFIRGLIVEEFDGTEPPPRVLDGLVDYVGALQTCETTPKPLRAADYASDAIRAARAAQGTLAKADSPAALVLIAAARARLGHIAERYPGEDLAWVRARLLKADAGLVAARDAVHAGETRRASRQLRRWIAGSAVWRRPVERAEPKSLFDESRLTAG